MHQLFLRRPRKDVVNMTKASAHYLTTMFARMFRNYTLSQNRCQTERIAPPGFCLRKTLLFRKNRGKSSTHANYVSARCRMVLRRLLAMPLPWTAEPEPLKWRSQLTDGGPGPSPSQAANISLHCLFMGIRQVQLFKNLEQSPSAAESHCKNV
jgi:hypothetical protein